MYELIYIIVPFVIWLCAIHRHDFGKHDSQREIGRNASYGFRQKISSVCEDVYVICLAI